MECSNCGRQLTSATWCGFCGTPQPEMASGAEAGKAIGERRRERFQRTVGVAFMYGTYGNEGAWTDAQHLMWLHDRLVREHGENPLYDYMHRLRDIIERLRLDEQAEPGCEI